MNATLKNAWDVLLLFLIPVGTGIPAGVSLAHARGLIWPQMLLIYFVSDVILAIAFEPVLWALGWWVRRSPVMTKFWAAYRAQTARMVAAYGTSTTWFRLVMISFGVDPMTGRAAAMAAGHGFVGGWLIAIAGDLIFFTLIMASTLWLNNVLGDGTWAAVLVMTVMFVAPALYRRWKSMRNGVRKQLDEHHPADDHRDPDQGRQI